MPRRVLAEPLALLNHDELLAEELRKRRCQGCDPPPSEGLRLEEIGYGVLNVGDAVI